MAYVATRRALLTPRRAAAAGAGAWSPLDLASLVVWYDASDASTLFTDAGTTPVSSDTQLVYQWNDKSASAKHMIQATEEARPTYEVAQVNSLSSVRFDGTNHKMASALISTARDNFCIYGVVQAINNSATECFFCNGNGSANGYGLALQTNSSKKGLLWGGLQWVSSATNPDTNVTLYVMRRTSGTTNLYLGGGAAAATSATNPNQPGTLSQMGQHIDANRANADVCEVAMTVGESLSDVNTLGAYLATKWGLSWTTVT